MMKKTILLISFILLPFLLLAQTKNITIQWGTDANKTAAVSSMKKANVSKENTFDNLRLQIDEEGLLFTDQWEDTGFADENSVEISNVSYGSLTSGELH